MRKNPASVFFNLGVLLSFAFCLGGALLSILSVSATSLSAMSYQRPGHTERISWTPDGLQPDAGSYSSVSADGRYVAFDSFDGDYVANDNNNAYDVFVRDTTTDTTELISLADVAARPLTADGLSSVSANALSADGRFVAFVSAADNLVTNDTNGYQDVFVRDLQTSSNILVSLNSAGTGSANSFSGS